MVLALVRSDGFEVAHVGDSAAYACETSGGGVRARRLTEDHGLGNARERARVRAEGGTIVESRGAMRVGGEYLVTRALGGTARRARGVSQTPDVVARRWRTNELGLILTSDGTTERLKPDDACAFVFTGKRKCDESAKVDTSIALDGDAASSTQSSEDAWDTVEVQGNSEVMNERVERALKCALELGSSDNVALAAVSAGRHNTQITVTQQKPSSLVAEMLSIGSNIEEYKITQLVAWSSGPYLPAKTPFRYDDMYDEEPQPTYNFGRKFEQSAIEGALTALALAPGKGEKNRVQNAITSYVGIIDSRLARGQDEGVRAGERPFARGHFGEVWRAKLSRQLTAQKLECASSAVSGDSSTVIMKRILVEQDLDLQLSADREVYFGRLLCGASPHIARYMHTFDKIPPSGRERWLVFRDEGESLERLMYAPESEVGGDSATLQLVSQSDWWRETRRSATGRRVLKTILRQIFAAVNVSHSNFGIVHRDIKPANVFVRFDDDIVQAKLGDFGSAMDTRRRIQLYGSTGPSAAQETAEYSPPEVLFGNDLIERTLKYDIWSLGVMMTELLSLGSPKAFSHISRKTRLALERELREVHPTARAVAYRLRAMLELCIVPHDTQVGTLLSWECTEVALMNIFKARDPLGVGLESIWALRLIRKLLSWDPNERPSAAQALEHAFFRDGDERGWKCGADASEHEWKSRCDALCASPCT